MKVIIRSYLFQLKTSLPPPTLEGESPRMIQKLYFSSVIINCKSRHHMLQYFLLSNGFKFPVSCIGLTFDQEE